MQTSLYHIAQIFEIHNRPVPEKSILFPLGKHIKQSYHEKYGKFPPRAEFIEGQEKFTSFAYSKSDFDLVLSRSQDFLRRVKENDITIDW